MIPIKFSEVQLLRRVRTHVCDAPIQQAGPSGPGSPVVSCPHTPLSLQLPPTALLAPSPSNPRVSPVPVPALPRPPWPRPKVPPQRQQGLLSKASQVAMPGFMLSPTPRKRESCWLPCPGTATWGRLPGLQHWAVGWNPEPAPRWQSLGSCRSPRRLRFPICEAGRSPASRGETPHCF